MLCLLLLFFVRSSVLARPPPSSRQLWDTHNYYGKYNKCSYEILPWPRYASCTPTEKGGRSLFLEQQHFHIELTPDSGVTNSSVLEAAFARYQRLIFDQPTRVSRGKLVEPQFLFEDDNTDSVEEKYGATGLQDDELWLKTLFVKILDSSSPFSDEMKREDADESYEITIDDDIAIVTAATVWGALYGLDTFSQLVQREDPMSGYIVRGLPLYISDSPRYPWRGILLDTSNHFLELSTILRLIDAMSAAKLNVLHWHIMDSYSFPFFSKKFPDLSQSGKWTADMPSINGGDETIYKSTYSSAMVHKIVHYATQRGIRVMPEIDMPGHGYSWGLSESLREITTACPLYTDELGHVDDIPLDPTLPLTYDVVLGLLEELSQIFPDSFLHLGGDEVKYGCWNESESIKAWMKEHELEENDFYSLEQLFFDRVGKFTTQILGRKVVAWEEVFFDSSGGTNGDHGTWIGSDALPPESTVVEVWTGPDFIAEATRHGYDALMAYGWYLDRQNPVDNEETWFFGDSWSQMYLVDPEPNSYKALSNKSGTGRALGGEISMWSEQVDDLNIDSQMWPRAAAAAERLWSPQHVTDLAAAAPRLSAFRCRIVSRFRVRAGPIWSDYCTATSDYMSDK